AGVGARGEVDGAPRSAVLVGFGGSLDRLVDRRAVDGHAIALRAEAPHVEDPVRTEGIRWWSAGIRGGDTSGNQWQCGTGHAYGARCEDATTAQRFVHGDLLHPVSREQRRS